MFFFQHIQACLYEKKKSTELSDKKAYSRYMGLTTVLYDYLAGVTRPCDIVVNSLITSDLVDGKGPPRWPSAGQRKLRAGQRSSH